MQGLDTLSFRLRGAIYGGTCVALTTIAALTGVLDSGRSQSCSHNSMALYGYSVSALGILVGNASYRVKQC